MTRTGNAPVAVLLIFEGSSSSSISSTKRSLSGLRSKTTSTSIVFLYTYVARSYSFGVKLIYPLSGESSFARFKSDSPNRELWLHQKTLSGFGDRLEVYAGLNELFGGIV
jgi:hypothetical protein